MVTKVTFYRGLLSLRRRNGQTRLKMGEFLGGSPQGACHCTLVGESRLESSTFQGKKIHIEILQLNWGKV